MGYALAPERSSRTMSAVQSDLPQGMVLNLSKYFSVNIYHVNSLIYSISTNTNFQVQNGLRIATNIISTPSTVASLSLVRVLFLLEPRNSVPTLRVNNTSAKMKVSFCCENVLKVYDARH